MRVSNIIDEDVCNYKKCSMFIGTITCSFKCCKDANIPFTVCQNYLLKNSKIIECDNSEIINRYTSNYLTDAIVFGGLEPFDQFEELYNFIADFRNVCDDDIVIYTGYREDEIISEVLKLKSYKNIIIKFGRFVPNKEKHFDELLGVNLASDNQFAKKIS